MNRIPYKLLTLRKHYELSQEFVAHKLNIDTLDYMAIENGTSLINDELVNKILRLYHIKKELLLNDDLEIDITKLKKLNFGRFNIFMFISVFLILIIIFSMFGVNKDISLNMNKDDNQIIVSNHEGYYFYEENEFKGVNIGYPVDKNVVRMYLNEESLIQLLNDGSVVSSDSIYDFKNWLNIVDLDVSNNIVMGRDYQNNLYCASLNNKCPFKVDKVTNLFVFDDEYLLISNGEVISSLKEIYTEKIINLDIKDISKYKDNIVVLYANGTVQGLNLTKKEFNKINEWTNIKKIVVIDDAIFGLTNDNSVLVATDNKEYQSVSKWNVLDIDGCEDYLVGYTGSDIVGVGNNAGNKFKKEENIVVAEELKPVTNIKHEYAGNQVRISFDHVAYADYYLITVNDLTSNEVLNNIFMLDTDSFNDGDSINIKIQAISKLSKFKNSIIVEYDFILEKPDEIIVTPDITPSASVEPSIIPSVEPSDKPNESPNSTPEVDENDQIKEEENEIKRKI